MAALGLVIGRASAQGANVTLKDKDDQVSYSIGANIGAGLKHQTEQQGLKIKADLVAAGIKDAFEGKTKLTEDQIREILGGLENDMREKASQAGDKNKKDGDAFLAANKSKPGVKILPNGLQYQVLTEGKGAKPKATDTVKVNYKGTLIDGTEFDASTKHGGPVTFPVNRVIRGWTEALQLMPVGSKWRLFIPSDLAYGPEGANGMIGPNSTLVFEVELLGIEPAAKEG